MTELSPKEEIDLLLAQGVTLSELKILLKLKKRKLSKEKYLEWSLELAKRGDRSDKR
ncbi:MAG: hypothetical protein QW051_00625 [Candidatus Aenigmatarchaeota archaeon]